MTKQEAYAAIKERYRLRAHQRDMLDQSPALNVILDQASRGNWDVVAGYLRAQGIV